MVAKESPRRIPVRKMSREAFLREMRESVLKYERRYEMNSQDMAHALEMGYVRETSELVKWIQHFRVLQRLEEKTPTAGTRGTTTKQSITVD